MRSWRLGRSFASLLQPVLAVVAAGFLVAGLTAGGAKAAGGSYLPAGFLDAPALSNPGPAAIEADLLSYDGKLDTITAQGGVRMVYHGYVLTADRLTFNQRTQEVHADGNVSMTDPSGTSFRMDSFEVTGGLREAFIKSLMLTTVDGSTISADDVHYGQTLETILTEAAYSPCGLCIDSKGRRIGWNVKAARMIYNRDGGYLILEQPSLAVLGIPVAWLPWLAFPDPSQPRRTGVRFPTINFAPATGARLTVPYFVGVGPDTDLIFTPTLMSRQGFLMGAEWVQRYQGLGQIDIKASGLYQLDRGAFAGTVGDRSWRGAIQTSGSFTPIEQWSAGWSYSVFSDAAYLTDYSLSDATSSVNQAYVTHLSDDYFFDLRVQQFVRLGNYLNNDPAQGMTLPVGRFSGVTDLGPNMGRLNYSAELLDVWRGADQTGMFGGVPYVYGHQGFKAHLKLEGAWEDQWILPGGVTATPYLGARLDAASYDRSAAALPAPYPTPSDASLLSLTPIAAMDIRWPLIANDGFDTHLLEPIAQLVYRGSSTTAVGITNDNAQSFIFDDTNLFSYNRFSGSDRQETGLRANFGGHYVGNFADGGWIDLMAGQSFHLAGLNALGVSDAAQTGTSSGLGGTASYIVAGARGAFPNGLEAGGKLVVDPAGLRVTRAGVGVQYATGGYSTGVDYIYVAPDAALGVPSAQHEVTVRAGVPVADYWSVNGSVTWDIAAATWRQVSAGANYDDGFLAYGLRGTAKPDSWGVGFSFDLKGPDGVGFGFGL